MCGCMVYVCRCWWVPRTWSYRCLQGISHGLWKQISGPLQERQAIFSTKPSLQPHHFLQKIILMSLGKNQVFTPTYKFKLY